MPSMISPEISWTQTEFRSSSLSFDSACVNLAEQVPDFLISRLALRELP